MFGRHQKWIVDLTLIKDGDVLVSRSVDGVVYLWDISEL